MTDQDIKAIVCRKFLNGDMSFPIHRDLQLLEEGICDSLGMVQIAYEVERACPGLKVQDQDIIRENFGSIASIQRFVAARGC